MFPTAGSLTTVLVVEARVEILIEDVGLIGVDGDLVPGLVIGLPGPRPRLLLSIRLRNVDRPPFLVLVDHCFHHLCCSALRERVQSRKDVVDFLGCAVVTEANAHCSARLLESQGLHDGDCIVVAGPREHSGLP